MMAWNYRRAGFNPPDRRRCGRECEMPVEYISAMRAILLIDHGSVKPEANHMVSCMANLLQHAVGESVIVRHSHMELAEPSIAQGVGECVRAGATEIIAFPYMLSPGKHVTRDVPRLVAEAARQFPDVSFRVTGAFGVHEKLAELIALRAGIDIAQPMSAADACRCWDAAGRVGSCGAACAARQSDTLAPA
jgi:sirohydrochlorin ferrochelatase